MAKNKKVQKTAKKVQLTNKEKKKIDNEVEETGRKDEGHLVLDICPRCGSCDIGTRIINIPGYMPEVTVCNKCNFRLSAPVQIPLTAVLEDDEVNEEELAKTRADFEKKLAKSQAPESTSEEIPELPKRGKLEKKQKLKEEVKAKGKKGK